MLALRRAREQHRREVHHQHDHKHEAGCAEHDERRANKRHDVCLQADRIQLHSAPPEVARVDDTADGVDGRSHFCRRRTAARADERRIRAIGSGLRKVDGKRDERIDRLWRTNRFIPHERKIGRQNANDRKRAPLETHVSGDDAGIRADPRPQIVRQHDDLLARLPDLVGRKPAASGRRDAEEIEEVRRRPCHRDLHWVTAFPHGENTPEESLKARGALDYGIWLLQLRDVGSADRCSREIADRFKVSVVAPHVIEVARILVGHRVDEDFLNGRVDDGKQAKSKGERGNRDYSKCRRAHQPARHQLDVAPPVAAAAPRCRRPQTFGEAVADGICKRNSP
jgi:hypothetical protein